VKSFKSIMMSKQPVKQIWAAIRDRTPELAEMLDDVDEIVVLERKQLLNGSVRLVNEWHATHRLLNSLKPVLGSDSIVWLDHADWSESDWQCRWRVEPQFLAGRVRCEGTTSYEPAMGGRGSKITFQGQLELDLRFLGGAASVIPSGAAQIVESIVTVLIPKNFRKMVEAADRLYTMQTDQGDISKRQPSPRLR
jgi:hypothetical protein